MSQLDLFETAADENDPATPKPADPGTEARALARRLPAGLRLGTSSWSFPGWDGLVYGGRYTREQLSRRGLAAYGRHPLLRTVGIDSTYYAMPDVRRLQGWAEQVPEDFRFLMKAPQALTAAWSREAGGPNPWYLDPTFAAERVIAPYVEGLGAKAGVLLLQFPPQGRRIAAEPRRFAERLYRFLGALPKGPTYAVELRDASLYGGELVGALRHGGARAVLCIHPRAAPPAVQRRLYAELNAGPVVVRWMLRHDLGYEEAREAFAPFDRLLAPDEASRSLVAAHCREALGAGQAVFVIANNKAEGSSPLTLARLAAALAE